MKITACDKVFSKLVRARHARAEGGEWVADCFTCGKTYPLHNLNAGHYIGRHMWGLRYHKWNVFPQCVPCNWTKEGNKVAFRERLKELYIKENGEEKWIIFDSYRTEPPSFNNKPPLWQLAEGEFAKEFRNELKELFEKCPGLKEAFSKKKKTTY